MHPSEIEILKNLSRKKKLKATFEKPYALDSLERGTMAFMKWLSSDNKHSPELEITVKDFSKDKYVILYDSDLKKHILVVCVDGIPFCKNCSSFDCGHIGFAICLKQHSSRYGTIDL